jgi:hypothetical protein
VLRSVWILDPTTGVWRAGPSLPKPMELLGAAVVGSQIHALIESTHEIYDSHTGTWRPGPAPEVPRHALSLFHADGALYAIGGCTVALHDSPIVERLADSR